MKAAALFVIRVYQRVLSPILPAACRFQPTCSDYARLAIEKWGIWRGAGLGVRRIARCHPWHPGGFDPVP